MAGAGYKLFNTGDVLTAAQVNTYLMEQTVMVFADAAARSTALTGVVSEGMISYLKDTNAVEVYNGSAWVASDDPNAIQNTIVDAKGDLITATAADTPARLAVGSNGDTLVADSAASTGLRWSGGLNLSNPIINSDFSIGQRGTSFALNNQAQYGLDRWFIFSQPASTTSRQTTNDTTNLPNIQYCVRVQRNSGNTSTGALYIHQPVESANAIPYAGKTVTLSFYARAGANYSPTSSIMVATLTTGTGTDQNPYNGYTGAVTAITQNATLTTTWQRFSYSATLATNITEFYPQFQMAPTGTAGTNDYFEVTGVQIDIGSVALPYRRSGGTIQGELAACQRYYYRLTTDSGSPYALFSSGGFFTSTTNFTALIQHPVPMRVKPSSLDISTVAAQDDTTAILAITASSIDANLNGNTLTGLSHTVSGATAARFGRLLSNNSASGYIGFSAEL